MRTAAALALSLAATTLASCRTTPSPPDLGAIYSKAAMHEGEDRNPVIVIPGLLGSQLEDADTGRIVWGAFAGDYANPGAADGALLTALPMAGGASLRELRDGVRSAGALDHVRIDLLGVSVQAEAYAYILSTLGVGGYRDETLGLAGAVDYGDRHFTCFQFDYDWRRDNVENARRLHDFILEKKAQVEAERERRHGRKGEEVKFDVIAHSMGGLIARYYLRYGPADLPEDGSLPPATWEGTRHLDSVILIGTPNAGSPLALAELVRGSRLAPLLPKYDPAVLGTYPSIYQLLPRTRHRALVRAEDPSRPLDADVFDPALWERMGWGLADAEQDLALAWILPDVQDPTERRRIALDHLRKCLERARRFTEALDAPEIPPVGFRIHLVAGDSVPTLSLLAVDERTGEIADAGLAPGDGTVLRASALLDERVGGEWRPRVRSPVAWGQVTFLFTDHLELTRDPAFTDNVLYLLLEAPRESGVASVGEAPAAGDIKTAGPGGPSRARK